MKARRRHELQTNILAEQLAETVEYLKNKGQVIGLVALAVVVALGVTWYWRYSARVSRQQGWSAMLALWHASPDEQPDYFARLEQVARSYRDPALRAAAWAQLGSRLLDEATGSEATDQPQETKKLLERAKTAFQKVLAETPEQMVPAAIAHLGLASMAASAGDFETAKQHYQAVAGSEQFDNTPFQRQAAESLTVLERLKSLPELAAAPSAERAATTQPGEG